MDQIVRQNTPEKHIRPKVQCWVPGCSFDSEQFPMKTFFSLPKDPFLRDFWLAAAGRRHHLPLEDIWFCDNHFPTNEEIKSAPFPLYNMPQKLCWTCFDTIKDKQYCVLSSNIKSKIPDCVEQIFGDASAISLIDVLKFCITEVPIDMNPIPVACHSCYRNIWIYYLFKKKCWYKEKAMEKEFSSGRYSSFRGCRACSINDYTNLVPIDENTELGPLLISMFTKRYSPNTVPLVLCQSCKSALDEILAFRRVFMMAQDYYKNYCERPQQNQANHKQTVVSLNEEDIARNQLLLGKVMLKEGLGLKDRSMSEAQHTNIWDTVQKSVMQYCCNQSIQNLKDTWSMMILEYTLGRLKGTELDDILSEYMRTESPKPTCKPLKKRYRAPTANSREPEVYSCNIKAAKQNVAVVPDTILGRNPEQIEIFEPNIKPPPSYYDITTSPPPYGLSNMYGTDTSTAFCSAVVGPNTAVTPSVKNRVPESGYQILYNRFLLNEGAPIEVRKKRHSKKLLRNYTQATVCAASNLAEKSMVFESGIKNKYPQTSFTAIIDLSRKLTSSENFPDTMLDGVWPTGSSLLNKNEPARVAKNRGSSNFVTNSGTGQSISLMSVATKSFHNSTITVPEMEAVKSQVINSRSTNLDTVKSDSNEYHQKVKQNSGNKPSYTNSIPVIQSANPSTSNVVIDLTEDEDKMVQVANISSSWEEKSPEDVTADAEIKESEDVEIIKASADNARKGDEEVVRPTPAQFALSKANQINNVEVGKDARSTSKVETTKYIRPIEQTCTKNQLYNELDIVQNKNTTEISHNYWTREEDMKFLDSLIVQFGHENRRQIEDIWRSLQNAAALSSKEAVSPADHWFDLIKSSKEKSLDQALSEKLSHCLELWEQYKSATENPSRAYKQTNGDDDKDIILVKNMINFLHESDVFDESWNVVLRKMSTHEEFVGYRYLDLKLRWKTLYRRYKLGMGGPKLRANLKEEFTLLLGLLKKLKLRNFWVTSIINDKRVSNRVSIFTSPKNRKKNAKGVAKPHQSFSFQDKIALIDAVKSEYEFLKNDGVLSANPWKTIISKIHRVAYNDWDGNRLWRMWSQMRLSAKIYAKDGSDYVDTEVWNLLQKHNNYLKNRRKQQEKPEDSFLILPEKKSDKQNESEQKSDKHDDEIAGAYSSNNIPPKKVQTLISSFCTAEKFDKNIDYAAEAENSSYCAVAVKQTDHKPSYAKESVRLEEKSSESKMDILTIQIDNDSDFSDGNSNCRDPATRIKSPNVKMWTESDKNIFFKSVKEEFGVMLKNDENISNPWTTIIKRLHESRYSMFTLKELNKVWRKIRIDAHLHENNNVMFVTPLDTEVNRLIKLLNNMKEVKRMSKLTKAKAAVKQKGKQRSEPKDDGESKSDAPKKKKRKKRTLTVSRAKKNKKTKLALPPVEPNRLEEDKKEAERIPWSEYEQRDLISIIESTGNQVFKPDIPKQFWNNVRKKLIEKGHSQRSVGALYYKWNRLLESAKMAWADQKVMEEFDKSVITFLTEVIKKNVKKTYAPENVEMKDAIRSNLDEEIIKDEQPCELYSVDRNKSDRGEICDRSPFTDRNDDGKYCIKENEQNNIERVCGEDRTEDDGGDSEDDYVSAADIMKM